MKNLLFVTVFVFFTLKSITSFAQITGNIFRDYNGNGIRSIHEPGVSGINVKAFNAADILISSTISANTGDYSLAIAGGTPVRIEFTIPETNPCGAIKSLDFSALSGAVYGTSVQFVLAPASNINYAINFPKDYTGDILTQSPKIFTTTYVNGDPLPPGAGTKKAVHSIAYDIADGSTTRTTSVATAHTVGSVWGVAYSNYANRLFLSSVLRRHAGYGPLGSGGIYMADPSGTDLVTNFIDLDALGISTRGSGTYAPVSTGTIVDFTTQVGSNSERGLPVSNLPSRDIAAFDQIGKIGLGGIDISEDGRYLFVINLFDKKLYEIDLQNPKAPIAPSAANIRSWTIPNPANIGGENRPWALKVNRGKIYIGMVCDAQASQLAANLKATIYEFNPAGVGNFGAAILNFPLNYTKGTSYGVQAGWYPWTNDFSKLPYFGGTDISYPQPIFTDIEIDDDGSFVLGFLDRAGMQSGVSNYSVDVTDNTAYNGYNGGDILRAYLNPNTCTLELESNGKEGPSSSKSATIGLGNNEGPGGGEFYTGDYENPVSTGLNETSQGGLGLLRGTGEVVLTVQDPSLGANVFGFKWLDNTTGLVNKAYGNLYSSTSGAFGKAASMGDVEFLLPNSPIEFGNRVWLDANSNGLQDAGETGISGVTLELFVDANNDNTPDGVAIASTTTNSKGEWYFNKANITGDGDPNTNGTQSEITPTIHYIIRPAISAWSAGSGQGSLMQLIPTMLHTSGNGAINLSDNDAMLTSGIPQIDITAGQYGENNHNLDFGFVNTVILPINILNFTAIQKTNQVNLQWTVSEQSNVSNYEVLFSADGRIFNTTIATIVANTNLNATYNAIHTTPIEGTNYYRLKTTEKDGTIGYSEIRKVIFGRTNMITVYPNPAKNFVSISFNEITLNKPASISILSIDGKLISQQKIASIIPIEILDVSKLTNGNYLLKVVTDNNTINTKLLINRQ